MEINLVTVSRLSSEVIDRDVIRIEHVDDPQFSDLMENIYDKYPALWRSGHYTMYWIYTKTEFLPIQDYISYVAAIRLMACKTIYVLVDDFYEYWEDNISYLQELDDIEKEQQLERGRDIYDVRIARKVGSEQMEEATKTKAVSAYSLTTDSDESPIRDEDEILAYAFKKDPKVNCHTTDMLRFVKLVKDLKQGFPKIKEQLYPIPDVVFDKRVFKDSRGNALQPQYFCVKHIYEMYISLRILRQLPMKANHINPGAYNWMTPQDGLDR
ncbi:hypothetical protein Trydic_g19776 [Trypoxylus dichotomus]